MKKLQNYYKIMIKFNNLKFINISGNKIELLNIKELWNQEVGFIFPLYEEMLLQKITECKFFSSECSFACYDEEKLVGFIISKVYDNEPVMSKYIDKGWISLFYVSRKYRKNGIGSTLLEKAEYALKNNGVKEILFGSDYDNFFPGIPCDFFNLTERFLEKRGYLLGGYSYDVMKKMNDYQLQEERKTEYCVRYAKITDKEEVLKFFEKNFYGRWYYEAEEFFNESFVENSYLIVLEREKVIGFLRCNKPTDIKISYNINWNKKFNKMEAYGPLGVDKDYRKLGLSRDLIVKALNDSFKNGATDVLIDWTGLIALYQLFGFEVWKSYRHTTKIYKN